MREGEWHQGPIPIDADRARTVLHEVGGAGLTAGFKTANLLRWAPYQAGGA